jgi:hypothetical protein
MTRISDLVIPTELYYAADDNGSSPYSTQIV